MWYSASEPYPVQLLFLWLSFIPALLLFTLIAASRVRDRRRGKPPAHSLRGTLGCYFLAWLPWIQFFARWLC